MTPFRWSDDQRTFGPFILSKDRCWTISAMLTATDTEDEDRVRNYLRLSMLGWTLIVMLPRLIDCYRAKVFPSSWDEATIKRLGRDWYWATNPREFGFSIMDGHLSVHFGRQAMDSSLDQQWGWFIPWTQWRFTCYSLFGLDGSMVWTQPAHVRRPGDLTSFNAQYAAEKACPSVLFKFLDFDGEEIIARTFINERRWKFGTGWFKWLSIFRPDKVRRSLDIRYSSEVGGDRPHRKGSWKGGTIGTGIDMLPGELHEAAFRRHCATSNLTLVEGSAKIDAGRPLIPGDQLPPPEGHYLRERYDMAEKPAGWNDAVLGYFYSGPEARQVMGSFSAAFHERSQVPPPLWSENPRARRRVDLRKVNFPWLFPAAKA